MRIQLLESKYSPNSIFIDSATGDRYVFDPSSKKFVKLPSQDPSDPNKPKKSGGMSGNAPEEFTRFLTTTLDAIRTAIGKDPDKAHFYIKALSELVRGNNDAAEDALDRFSVGQFLKENGLR